MPGLTVADTIRILVATDNHVGYNERDHIRGDDSWQSFHEIMCMAKKRDVDMVLLAGDLFHDNKPSRKAMYNVMRSIRMNCFGSKPCELETLSDGSEHFNPTFGWVNYEDPNLNVAIPVFSIHGNHDDPASEGHFAALDILEMSGLLNYYGRTPESDNINVKPVLLQKGRTKLALYGLSNVRDERLYRTFRDRKVKFFRPHTQLEDWFNMICVHQNHHAYTETSHLPENFLPDFLDLVIWGHEHECVIQPHHNPEMNFKVIQPGSSVATSLVAGEAVPKQVTIVSITGREFKSEPIRLKTVRPFVYKDIVLAQEKEAVRISKKDNHRWELTRYLMGIVEGLIEQAKAEWQEAQEEHEDGSDEEDTPEYPLPLIRMRVETTPPDGGGKFDCENPQRFSGRFQNMVANTTDVIQYYAKKKSAGGARKTKDEVAEKAIMERFEGMDAIKVDQLVHEFLAAQSLTILPQNYFGDAVTQFIDKDDKHAMESFVNDALASQIKHLVSLHQGGDENTEEDEEVENSMQEQIEHYRTQVEELFAKGVIKAKRDKKRFKPKPDAWDSDLDGDWEDQPGALLRPDENDGDDFGNGEDGTPAPKPATRGPSRGRSGRAANTASTRGRGAATKKPATTRGKKKVIDSDEEGEEDDDVIMLDDDDDEDDSQALFFRDNKPAAKKLAKTSTRSKKAASQPIKRPPARAAASRSKQSTLNFTNSQRSVLGNGKGKSQSVLSDDIDDDDDDDDAFEPVSSVKGRR